MWLKIPLIQTMETYISANLQLTFLQDELGKAGVGLLWLSNRLPMVIYSMPRDADEILASTLGSRAASGNSIAIP